MILASSLKETRQMILRSDLTIDLLRICSRAPQTLRQLVRTPNYPGIDAQVHSMRTELSITAAVSDVRHHGLIARVDLVEDPIYPRMHAERLRTTLLAFLACPELAFQEPTAYTAYIDGWFSLPMVLRQLEDRCQPVHALFLAFPQLAHRAIYAPGNREPSAQVFGWYRLCDLPTRPGHPKLVRTLAEDHRPALPAGRRVLYRLLREDGTFRGLTRRLIERRLASPRDEEETDVEALPPEVPALLPGRLLPAPVARRRFLTG